MTISSSRKFYDPFSPGEYSAIKLSKIFLHPSLASKPNPGLPHRIPSKRVSTFDSPSRMSRNMHPLKCVEEQLREGGPSCVFHFFFFLSVADYLVSTLEAPSSWTSFVVIRSTPTQTRGSFVLHHHLPAYFVLAVATKGLRNFLRMRMVWSSCPNDDGILVHSNRNNQQSSHRLPPRGLS